MAEATLYLNWTSIRIGPDIIDASEDEPAGSRVQWHPSAHSIYIVKKEMREIEIRIEREVTSIEFEKGSFDKATGACSKTCSVNLHLISTRPPIVSGFDASSPLGNRLSIQFLLDNKENVSLYINFVQWLKSNVTGTAKEVKDLSWLWDPNLDVSDELEIGSGSSSSAVSINTTARDDNDNQDSYVQLTCGLLFPKSSLIFLDHGKWANDEVLNIGLKWQLTCAEAKKPDLNCHIFNTWFFSKLSSEGPGGVGRWGTLKELLEKQFILVPCHLDNHHWALGIIDNPGAAIAARYDQKPNIYVLDSLHSVTSYKTIANKLNDYLKYIAKQHLHPDEEVVSTNLFSASVPQQGNGSDCGFYVVHFANVFMQDPEGCRKFITTNTTNHGRVNATWKNVEAMNMRRTMREYIHSCMASSDE